VKRGTPERHAIDAIARAVVSGRRGQGRRADALADAVAACMHNRLEAVGAPGARRTRRRTPYRSPLLRLLFDRAAKHLAAWGSRAEVGPNQA